MSDFNLPVYWIDASREIGKLNDGDDDDEDAKRKQCVTNRCSFVVLDRGREKKRFLVLLPPGVENFQRATERGDEFFVVSGSLWVVVGWRRRCRLLRVLRVPLVLLLSGVWECDASSRKIRYKRRGPKNEPRHEKQSRLDKRPVDGQEGRLAKGTHGRPGERCVIVMGSFSLLSDAEC